MHKLKHIIIIYKANHAKAKQTALDIQSWLKEKNITSTLFSPNDLRKQFDQEIKCAQTVIILGGDGTFIGTARKLVGTNIPLLGINFGQLGFLLEFSPNDWTQALEQLYTQKLLLQKKEVLTWSIIYKDTLLKKGVAINDIVVGRGALARLLPIHVTINKHALGTIRSDGIIVSTPLGTSAYTISAYGPIVHPEISALTITSISTLFRSMPPIVIPSTTTITLKPLSKTMDVFLTIDGQEGIALDAGAHVTVQGLQNSFNMYTTSNYNYFQQVQNKSLILSQTTN